MSNLKKAEVVYVSTNDDLHTVLACFQINEISHVPVMGDGQLVGMISKTDVVEYLYNNVQELENSSFLEVMETIKAKQLMVQPLIEATTSDTQATILEKLMDHEVGSVVIRDDNGKLAGIVTIKDMLQYLSQNQEQQTSFTDSLGGQLVQWMDEKGILRISKALADIGI